MIKEVKNIVSGTRSIFDEHFWKVSEILVEISKTFKEVTCQLYEKLLL